MIDIQKEVQFYLKEESAQPNTEQKEGIGFFDALEKAMNRIGKEQYKSARNIEEILETLNGFMNSIEATPSNGQQGRYIETALELMDMMEDMYHAVCQGPSEAWRIQMNLLWKKAGEALKRCNLERMEPLGSSFSAELHTAKEVQTYPGVPNGHILDVVRSGYLADGKVVRKAHVVVNRNEQQRGVNS